MSHDTADRTAWRRELPVLKGPLVTLREPTPEDVGALLDVLSTADASRFGLDDVSDLSVAALIDQVRVEREKGAAFTFAILAAGRRVVGLVRARALDPVFEAAEWEGTLLPSLRGTGVFVEAARLVGSFAFGTLGTHRLESRVLLQNGRANAALRKLGAVQEGVLRRSLRADGQYYDQVLWSVLRDDWTDRWISTAERVH
ncbi:MAG: GNAT family N-acetyltransferase [Vicinamibacterales bacterium]